MTLFTAQGSSKMSEAEKIVALIKEVGVWRLANWDGCTCSNFSLRDVNIDIGCGKGGPRMVTVSSRSLDYYSQRGDVDLRMIGEEVARQVQESDGRSPTIGVSVKNPD